MDELAPIRAYLEGPAPRGDADVYLGASRERLRGVVRFLLLFGGANLLFFVGIAVVAGWPDRVLDTVVTAVTGGGAVLAVILGGTYFYYRQDVSLGRRLLTHGRGRPAEVVALSRGAGGRGSTAIDVRFEADSGPQTARFFAPLSDADRQALERAHAMLLEAGPHRAVYLPRVGLVSTR